jgi:predicted nucleotide-binding protein
MHNSQEKKISLVNRLKNDLSLIKYGDEKYIGAFLRKLKDSLPYLISNPMDYEEDLKHIHFWPLSLTRNTTEELMHAWENGKNALNSLLDCILEKIDIENQFGIREKGSKMDIEGGISDYKNIFIVHGHDALMKNLVNSFVIKIGLNPIILDEKENQGNTVIEKFEQAAANASYAIILMSPDDKVLPEDDKIIYRPRQNVVFEMGYFISVLGRSRVLILSKRNLPLEFPTDLSGLIHEAFEENNDRWKIRIIKELNILGYGIDANNLL